MISYIYWLFGWDHSTTKDILCVNSFAKTNRQFNYVVQIFPTEDD